MIQPRKFRQRTVLPWRRAVFKAGSSRLAVDSADGGPHVVARGITRYGSAGINYLTRRHTRDLRQRPGDSYGESIVHRDDLVVTIDSGVIS